MASTLPGCSRSHRDDDAVILSMLPDAKIFAKRLVRYGMDYDDAYSAICLGLVASVRNARGVLDWRGFCITAMHRLMMRHQRAMMRAGRVFGKNAIDPADCDLLAEHKDADPMMMGAVMSVADGLTGREKLIFDMHYMRDIDLKDIAVELGVHNTALTPYHRSLKKKLREAFNDTMGG